MLDGAAKIGKLAARAAEQGMPGGGDDRPREHVWGV